MRPVDGAILAAQVRHWNDIFDWGGRWVRELVTRSHDPERTTILDVGAGQGKYRVLLPEYPSVDAVEVWESTVTTERLDDLYRSVFIVDVRDFVHSDRWHELRYDVVIFGDVLEHLEREDAKDVLERVYDRCDDVVVVVPYRYEQGAENGNEYQRHLQPDLTPELMMAAYPDLRLVALDVHPDGQPRKGLYRRYV
jgi:hypothetical protein